MSEKTNSQASVTSEQAAADVKKAVEEKIVKDGVYTLKSGMRVKLHPVAANVLREAQTRIPDPQPRMFTNPTTGREEINPANPDFIRESQEVEELRIRASTDAMLLFGLELMEDIPTDNRWMDNLKYLSLITDEQYEQATNEGGNKFLRELLYKKYVVSDSFVINKIAELSGVTQEMIAQARKQFQRPQEQRAD